MESRAHDGGKGKVAGIQKKTYLVAGCVNGEGGEHHRLADATDPEEKDC